MSNSIPFLPDNAYRVALCEVMDKLLSCRDGDGALLYLYCLRFGEPRTAQDARDVAAALGFTQERYDRAAFTLTSLFVPKESSAAKTIEAPLYQASELREHRSKNAEFAAVCDAAEEIIGKTLSETLLRALFTTYDHLGLSADAIIELLTYLKGQNGMVRVADLRHESYLWADMGIFTGQAAQGYLSRLNASEPLGEALLSAIGSEKRALRPPEKRLVAFALSRAFQPDALALAAKRAQERLGKFSADYVRGILDTWDQKGVHTASEITALEPETERAAAPTAQNAPTSQGTLASWEKDWLDEVARRKKKEE